MKKSIGELIQVNNQLYDRKTKLEETLTHLMSLSQNPQDMMLNNIKPEELEKKLNEAIRSIAGIEGQISMFNYFIQEVL